MNYLKTTYSLLILQVCSMNSINILIIVLLSTKEYFQLLKIKTILISKRMALIKNQFKAKKKFKISS